MTANIGAWQRGLATPEERAPKTCAQCGETKPRVSFPHRKNSRDGRGARCRPCLNSRDYRKGRYGVVPT